jgi:hypothetical protein
MGARATHVNMIRVSPFFPFVLLLVIPGLLVILLAAQVWRRSAF